jgi:hypothetical protein
VVGVSVKVQLVAAEDDLDLQLVPEPTEIPVSGPEEAADVLMIPEADATF